MKLWVGSVPIFVPKTDARNEGSENAIDTNFFVATGLNL